LQTHGLKRDLVLRRAGRSPRQPARHRPNRKTNFQALEKYGRDLTALAGRGRSSRHRPRRRNPARDAGVDAAHKNNPVLIGETRRRKTAIAEGLARRIVSGDVPGILKNKRLSPWTSAHDRRRQVSGEFEDRLKAFLKEIAAAKGAIYPCSR